MGLTGFALVQQNLAVEAAAVAETEADNARAAEGTAEAESTRAIESANAAATAQADAEQQAQIALARQLAAQSDVAFRDWDYELALLLAIEAGQASLNANEQHILEADAGLRTYRASMPLTGAVPKWPDGNMAATSRHLRAIFAGQLMTESQVSVIIATKGDCIALRLCQRCRDGPCSEENSIPIGSL